jgi:hypothetical protein
LLSANVETVLSLSQLAAASTPAGPSVLLGLNATEKGLLLADPVPNGEPESALRPLGFTLKTDTLLLP